MLIFENSNSCVSLLVHRLRYDSNIIQDVKPKGLKEKGNNETDNKYIWYVSYKNKLFFHFNIFSCFCKKRSSLLDYNSLKNTII